MTAPVLEFPIVWAEPDDADVTWERDDMHMPFALSPLSIDYVRVLIDGMRYGRDKVGNPWRWHVRFLNGYVYMAARETRPVPDEAAAIAAIAEMQRALVPTALDYWNDRALPELRATRDWFRSLDVEGGSLVSLADVWAEAWARAERAWQIHFLAIRGPYQVADDLADLYEIVVPDAPPGEALRLIQGRATELLDVDRAINELAGMVASDPRLRAAFQGGTPSRDELAELSEAAGLLAALDTFLDEHGHLGGSFDDLAFPSWADEPAMVLEDVARRLLSEGPSSAARLQALRAEADTLAGSVRERLSRDPEGLIRFERLLTDARSVGPLTEIHNYWIDRLIHALVRSFALRIGARLAGADVIDAPADVLYLDRTEVGDLLRGPADRRAAIVERRAEHERQKRLDAPYRVGRAPEAPSEPDRFDGARFEPDVDGTLRGTGASPGTVMGIARIVLGPADFAMVRPGDIIVAPSSNPSWIPLFTFAGGVLTNTGGVACHAAVVAREFGLPAVVGLGDATVRIPDGAMVEFDGTTGRVRIL
ncbi:MAG TPA: PEP-utilizing enzyme [Candidatus Limnocylindrales bacterium]|nr:PEP-utilizing enzyme [Candidatus Limnocylindrales bacterium]